MLNIQNQQMTLTPQFFHQPVAAPQSLPSPSKERAAVDNLSISGATQPTNPYASQGASTAKVKVDAWGKGKNDCLEHILMNQGYSRREIYGKDENGKSLLDKVAAVNNLRNPNMVIAGSELKVPSKQKDTGEQPGGASTDYGHQNLRYTSEVAEGTHGEHKLTHQDGTEYNTSTLHSANGKAETRVVSEADEKSSKIDIHDADKKANTIVGYDDQSVQTWNDGGDFENDIHTKVDISEQSRDGYFENKARSFAEFFGLQKKEEVKGGLVEGASDVTVLQNDNGANVFATFNGEERHVVSTAGDTDDGFLERAGETVDNGVAAARNWWNRVTR